MDNDKNNKIFKKLPKILAVLITPIFLIQISNINYHLYLKYQWLDIPMHLAGGAWLGIFFFYIFCYRYPVFDYKKNFWITVIAAISFVALVGVAWEIYEFILDQIFLSRLQLNPKDTIKDLIDDLAGGTISASIIAAYLRKK